MYYVVIVVNLSLQVQANAIWTYTVQKPFHHHEGTVSARAKSYMLDYSRTNFSQIQPRHNVASIRGKVHDLDFCQSSGQEHTQKQHIINGTCL